MAAADRHGIVCPNPFTFLPFTWNVLLHSPPCIQGVTVERLWEEMKRVYNG